MASTIPDVSRDRETTPSRPDRSVDFRLGFLLFMNLIGAGMVFLMGFYASGRIAQGKPSVQIPERVTVSVAHGQEIDATELRKMESTIALQRESIDQVQQQVDGLKAIQSRWTLWIEANSNRIGEFVGRGPISTNALALPPNAPTPTTNAAVLPTNASVLPTNASVLPTNAAVLPTNATVLPTSTASSATTSGEQKK